MMSRFSDEARRRTAPVWDAIHAMPFNRKLADGSLPREAFRQYMVQDAIYLVAYARALALAAARAPNTDEIEFFADSAKGAIVVERALHAEYLAKFDIPLDAIARAEPSPACDAYTSFLIATAANASYEEAVAAILPCFWIYWDVGKALHGASVPGNFYQAWVDTYAGDAFGSSVERCRDIVDEAAARATPQRVEAMHRAFARCCQYEWMFWDSAWRLEAWPV
jgi:thiaminase/transcriptional activator TenA